MKQDYTFLVGGEAGQGLQTIGAVLAKALARQGLHIFANQDYYSRVRGGLTFSKFGRPRATKMPPPQFPEPGWPGGIHRGRHGGKKYL